MLIKMIDDDDDEANPGPMPQLEDMDPHLSALRAQLEALDREEAQSRAVRKQKDDALQAKNLPGAARGRGAQGARQGVSGLGREIGAAGQDRAHEVRRSGAGAGDALVAAERRHAAALRGSAARRRADPYR